MYIYFISLKYKHLFSFVNESVRGPVDDFFCVSEHMRRRHAVRRGRVASRVYTKVVNGVPQKFEGAAGGMATAPNFKNAVKSEMKHELLNYEHQLAAKARLEVKEAAAKAAAAARKQVSAKVTKMSEELRDVEHRLWLKERRKKLAVENVFGSLGSLGRSHAERAQRTTGEAPRRVAADHQRGSSASMVPRAGSETQTLPGAGPVVGAQKRPVEHARPTSAQELAMAKALGFYSVHALHAHQRAVQGGVNMWGQRKGDMRTKALSRALPNPAAVEKIRELEAAAAKPHSPKHKVDSFVL
jgi:hypothetical protein